MGGAVKWIKMPIDFDDLPGVVRAGFEGAAVYAFLLRVAARHHDAWQGVVPSEYLDAEYIANRLRCSVETATCGLAKLKGSGLLDGCHLVGWSKWIGDYSTPRVRRHRKSKSGNLQADETVSNVSNVSGVSKRFETVSPVSANFARFRPKRDSGDLPDPNATELPLHRDGEKSRSTDSNHLDRDETVTNVSVTNETPIELDLSKKESKTASATQPRVTRSRLPWTSRELLDAFEAGAGDTFARVALTKGQAIQAGRVIRWLAQHGYTLEDVTRAGEYAASWARSPLTVGWLVKDGTLATQIECAKKGAKGTQWTDEDEAKMQSELALLRKR